MAEGVRGRKTEQGKEGFDISLHGFKYFKLPMSCGGLGRGRQPCKGRPPSLCTLPVSEYASAGKGKVQDCQGAARDRGAEEGFGITAD